MYTYDQLKKEVINRAREEAINRAIENKDEKISELEKCIESSKNTEDKAYCASKLGTHYSFIEQHENNFPGRNSGKYYHIAYDLVPSNSEYKSMACLHTYASITSHSTTNIMSEIEASTLSQSFAMLDKCQNFINSHVIITTASDLMIARAANNLGVYYFAQSQLEQSKQFFKTAYNFDTYLKANHGANLALVYFTLGEYEKAAPLSVECIKTVITEDFTKTTKADCASVIGQILMKEKAYPDTLPFFRLADNLAPNNGYHILHLAKSHLVNKEYEKAKSYFDQCATMELTEQFSEEALSNCRKGSELLGSIQDEL